MNIFLSNLHYVKTVNVGQLGLFKRHQKSKRNFKFYKAEYPNVAANKNNFLTALKNGKISFPVSSGLSRQVQLGFLIFFTIMTIIASCKLLNSKRCKH